MKQFGHLIINLISFRELKMSFKAQWGIDIAIIRGTILNQNHSDSITCEESWRSRSFDTMWCIQMVLNQYNPMNRGAMNRNSMNGANTINRDSMNSDSAMNRYPIIRHSNDSRHCSDLRQCSESRHCDESKSRRFNTLRWILILQTVTLLWFMTLR